MLYQIISSEKPEVLQAELNSRLRDGWTLHSFHTAMCQGYQGGIHILYTALVERLRPGTFR